MKILLLGHSGMLGSSVEKLLMDDEEHDVITSSTKSGRAPIDHEKGKRVKVLPQNNKTRCNNKLCSCHFN